MTSKCKKCKDKVKNSYEFCPNCGIRLKYNSQEEWGMLGRNDTVAPENNISSLLGNLNTGNLGKMLNGAMKMLEKELSKGVQENSNQKTKFKLMINGKEVNPKNFKQIQRKEKKPIKIMPIEFSKENQNKFQKLKKTEPKTNLKRFGDQINYELEIPGVSSIKDVSILRLEKGLEVRAIAKKIAYQKRIAIDMPLSKYSLIDNTLTLELEANE